MNKAVRIALALIASSVLCCCIFENCMFTALVAVLSFCFLFFFDIPLFQQVYRFNTDY